MKRTIINGLIAGLSSSLLVACGGASDSSSADNTMLATTAACYAAWNASTIYNGGAQVSYNGVNYTAAYWTQGNNPSTNNGPAGSGQPWISNGACGATPTPTPTPAPTPTPTPTPTPAPTPTPTPAPTPTPTPAPTPSCTYQTWTSGVNYSLGTIVKYPANGQFYKEVNATANGSDGTDPTISTWYWQPTTCGSTPTPAPTPTPTPAPTPTPTPAPTPTPTPAPTPTPSCSYQTWTTGVNYALGTIVKYPANGNFYKEVNAGTNGSDATDPTISTWYWSPTTCGSTPTPTPTSTAIVGGYYPSWVASPVRLRNIDSHYNLIYLFAATAPAGNTSGAVTWTPPSDVNGAATNWSADIQYARNTQHRKIILSVGGAGHAMSFPNRTVSTNFVNSIDTLYNQWGGFDGIDWNTFEGQTPDTSEMIWASQELKRRHPGFIVTAPPAPWNTTDQQFCKDMLNAGAIDYCAPQYYDGPSLADPAWVLPNVDTWVNLIGANHMVIGFGVDPNTANYWNISSAVSTWKQIKAKYPTIHGAFDWQINNDLLQGYPFAQQLGPLVP